MDLESFSQCIDYVGSLSIHRDEFLAMVSSSKKAWWEAPLVGSIIGAVTAMITFSIGKYIESSKKTKDLANKMANIEDEIRRIQIRAAQACTNGLKVKKQKQEGVDPVEHDFLKLNTYCLEQFF